MMYDGDSTNFRTPPAGCTEKWVDVYLTNSAKELYDGNPQNDDVFMCSMMSVALDKSRTVASVVAEATEYVMPAWPFTYDWDGSVEEGGFSNHILRKVKAGDILRLGNVTSGYSTYLTVNEVVLVDHLVNGLGSTYNDTSSAVSTPVPLSFYPVIDMDPIWADLDTTTADSRVYDQRSWSGVAADYVLPGIGDAAQQKSYKTMRYGQLLPFKDLTVSGNSTTVSGDEARWHDLTNGNLIQGVTRTSSASVWDLGNVNDLANASCTSWTTLSGKRYSFKKGGIAHMVLRVGNQLDATAPPRAFYAESGNGKTAITQFNAVQDAVARRHEVRLPMQRKFVSRVYRQYKYVRRETLSDATGHHALTFPVVIPFQVQVSLEGSSVQSIVDNSSYNFHLDKLFFRMTAIEFLDTYATHVDFAATLQTNLELAGEVTLLQKSMSADGLKLVLEFKYTMFFRSEFETGSFTRLHRAFTLSTAADPRLRLEKVSAAMSRTVNLYTQRPMSPTDANYMKLNVVHIDVIPNLPAPQRLVPSSSNPLVLSDTVPSEAVWTGTLPGWTPPASSDANYENYFAGIGKSTLGVGSATPEGYWIETTTTFDYPEEGLIFPAYLQPPQDKNDFGVTLGQRIKAVKCIKLVGYSIVNKSNFGTHQQHEFSNDECLIMNLQGVTGEVVSNNAHADGAFAVLHVASSFLSDSTLEYYRLDEQGVVTIQLDNETSALRSLKVSLTDRQGNEAHIGRVNLWFKLKVVQS